MPEIWQRKISRRRFLQASGLTVLAVACGGKGVETLRPSGTGGVPAVEFLEPSTKLSGDLKILVWEHFVPRHDKWFDPFAKEWGRRVGVNVTVDHINVTDVPARIASEISAGSGHDILQYIAPLAQYEPSVVDLTDLTQEAEQKYGKQVEVCKKSSFNPTTNKFFAYAPGWVPDPGDYRKSLWEQVGLPNGPTTYDELLQGGSDIKSKMGVQMGIGMSQEIDSNMAGRALLWSFGAAEQDENENVTINSPETVAAVEYMTKLFKGAMTDEIFSWNAASNNQALIAGKASYILNSISAYRTAQTTNPQVAQDVLFSKALKGPGGDGLVAQHVMYNYIVPQYSKSVDAAKEFLLNYTHNFSRVTWESELYDFPSFEKLSPQRDSWLSNDPFGSTPADKLTVLKDALDWSTNVGHRGPASAAIGEVFATFIIPNMFAEAARGESTPQEAVQKAERQIKQIFDKWRQKGFIGGGS
jgi:ABC-type glycerol-3-phosphate transport system substrate-binding protein